MGDGAKLLNAGSVIVDYAVVTGTAFENSDYVRNEDVVLPSTSYDPSEWTATPCSYPTDGTPGTHTTVMQAPGPTIANIVTDPVAPLPGEAVDVSADVTDTTAITSVSLFWGTSPLSLGTEIDMSLVSGDTYETDTSIPAQSAGITVYYKIEAVNDLPGTSVSDVESYALPYTLTIAEIQGAGTSSPYDGYAAITSGVVTSLFGSYFTLQDGTGVRSGVWARGLFAPSVGDTVTVRGTVTESDGANTGNTFIVGADVQSSAPAAVMPAPTVITTLALSSEDYEGVLVMVDDAECTNTVLGDGEWAIDDGSGTGYVDDLGYAFTPTLGTLYDISGPLSVPRRRLQARAEGRGRHSLGRRRLGARTPPGLRARRDECARDLHRGRRRGHFGDPGQLRDSRTDRQCRRAGRVAPRPGAAHRVRHVAHQLHAHR